MMNSVNPFIFTLSLFQVLVVIDCDKHSTAIPKHGCLNTQTSTPEASGSADQNELKPDHFRKLGKVKNMKECLEKCCDTEHCDLAMMSYGGQTCYAVACFSENLCQMLPAYPTRISFDIAHVQRW